MKNVILYSLPLMVAGSIFCSTVNAANSVAADQKNQVASELVKSLKAKRHLAPRTGVMGFKNCTANIAKVNSNKPFAQLQTPVLNFLSDEDGNVWYYTQESTYRDGSFGAAISKSTINVYDNNHELAGTLTVEIPDDMTVNAITPYGTITKKFFDLNDKDSEVLVELHEVGNVENNFQGKYHTQVYHLDGTKSMEFEGAGVFLSIKKNSWSKYQRFVLTSKKVEASEDRTDESGNPLMVDMAYIDIYKPASWGKDPEVEHTFKQDLEYTYYGNDEMPITIYNVDGEPYYVLAHYSKIYDSGQESEDTDFFVPTKDNSYIIKTFDKNYNIVDDLDIPIEPASDTDFRMVQIGNFADMSVTKDLFDDTDNLAYVLTYCDMTTKVDDYRYKFVAFDNKGNKIKDICDGVYKTWFKLNSIDGAEDQMAFMQYIDDDETMQQVKIVNIPSGENNITMPDHIDGKLISTVMNRYGTKDNYKYLMKINEGDTDGKGNVIANVAWLNKDMTVDHYTSYNLGSQAENFSLTLADTYVNPYLFNTNDKLEFFFQAKVKQKGGTKLDNVYMVGDEDGNILHTFENGDKGTISSMGCFKASEGNNEMYVAYSNDNGMYNFDFYKLPLTKFEKGGDGTAENPYLIATAGDLLQINGEPAANYKMVDDIKMDTYNNVNSTWIPIKNFTGKLDGDNHYIADLNIKSTESSVGLFSELGENSEVKNLVLAAPKVEIESQNSTIGTLAASAISGNIENVHVYNAEMSGTSSATVGGIVGQAALNSNISTVSFNNGSIDNAEASSVGSIAGDIRTSTTIKAAAANNVSIKAQSSVGGIVGAAMQSTVSDSHANGEFSAENTVGGIVGSNNATVVNKCIFDGTVNVSEASWSGLSAAGIVGALEADWSGSKTAIITNNIANGTVNIKSEDADGATDDGTLHRIVGRTIANEYYEPGETVQTEQRLANNWAINTMTVAGKTVTSSDETSVEGYDANASDITKESLGGVGFGFGTTADQPWKESGSTMPVLFFENNLMALVLSQDYIVMDEDETNDKLTVAAYGADINEAEVTVEDESVVEITETEVTDETAIIKLHAKKDGETNVNITLGKTTVSCKVKVNGVSGISEATVNTGNGLVIVPGNGCVKADGAVTMNVYTICGAKAAKANGSSVSTSQLGKGMFIVEATDANGNKTTAKVVIR